VNVGKRASADPVLAKASLDASSIMLAMAKAAPTKRLPLMEASLRRLGVQPSDVVAEMKKALVPGANPDQVTFDAMRLAIANTRLDHSLDNIRHAVASQSGWDSLVDTGLGGLSVNDRATGCMISSGAGVVGGVASVVPGYGTLIGGIIGIGSGIAGQALDCGKEARDAATAAAQAQAQLAAAQQAAAAQQTAAASASRQHRFQTVATGGAILLTVLGVAWLALD
jgi:hypothetical protein